MATKYSASELESAARVIEKYRLRAFQLVQDELKEGLEVGRILDVRLDKDDNIFVGFTYRTDNIFADYVTTYWTFTLEDFNDG